MNRANRDTILCARTEHLLCHVAHLFRRTHDDFRKAPKANYFAYKVWSRNLYFPCAGDVKHFYSIASRSLSQTRHMLAYAIEDRYAYVVELLGKGKLSEIQNVLTVRTGRTTTRCLGPKSLQSSSTGNCKESHRTSYPPQSEQNYRVLLPVLARRIFA